MRSTQGVNYIKLFGINLPTLFTKLDHFIKTNNIVFRVPYMR